MRSFDSEDEMLDFGRTLGKYDGEIVALNDERIFLSGTNLAYEDSLFEIAAEALGKSMKLFGAKEEIDICSVCKVRDLLFESVKENSGVEIIDAITEY